MEWFGQAKIDYAHAAQPRPMQNLDGSKTDLLKVVEENTPPCSLNPLLFNGHAQTLWSATKPVGPKLYYKRHIFESDHETFVGTFAVDFVVDKYEGEDASLYRRTTYYSEEEIANIGSQDNKPMAVVLHGLTGGSHEIYLRQAIAPLVGEGGWEACVIIARGCGKSTLTSKYMYNGRATWDLRQLVKWLKVKFPNRALYGVGFSFGGNILTNYLGEEDENCLLSGAVSCSNPFNLELSNGILSKQYVGKEVYLRVMAEALKAAVKSHKEVLDKDGTIDTDAVAKVRYPYEFDRIVECGLWGYPTETAYYRDASCSDSVLDIRVPYLAIHSTDDPVAPQEALPWAEIRQNPNTVLLTTSLGGHLSWYQSDGGRWFTKPVANFLNHLAFKTDPSSLGPAPQIAEARAKNLAYAPMNRKMVIE